MPAGQVVALPVTLVGHPPFTAGSPLQTTTTVVPPAPLKGTHFPVGSIIVPGGQNAPVALGGATQAGGAPVKPGGQVPPVAVEAEHLPSGVIYEPGGQKVPVAVPPVAVVHVPFGPIKAGGGQNTPDCVPPDEVVHVPLAPMKEPAGQAIAVAVPAPLAVVQVWVFGSINVPNGQNAALPVVPPGGGAQFARAAQIVPVVVAPVGVEQMPWALIIVPGGQDVATTLTAPPVDVQAPFDIIVPGGQNCPVVAPPLEFLQEPSELTVDPGGQTIPATDAPAAVVHAPAVIAAPAGQAIMALTVPVAE